MLPKGHGGDIHTSKPDDAPERYVANIVWSTQTGPETWGTWTRSFEMTRETPLGDVIDWIENMGRGDNKLPFSSVEIVPLERKETT